MKGLTLSFLSLVASVTAHMAGHRCPASPPYGRALQLLVDTAVADVEGQRYDAALSAFRKAQEAAFHAC